MNTIDIILLALAVYFSLLGFARGFIRSLFGPIALIVGTWIAVLYYQLTHDTIIALCLGLCAPIILSILLRFIVGGFLKTLNPDQQPSLISRCSGAFITLLWGWVFVILTVILLDVFPSPLKQIQTMQHYLRQSVFAKITVFPFKSLIIPSSPNPKSSRPVSIEELARDPRIASLMSDPDIIKDAQDRNFAAMLKNPKVMQFTQEMMNDPALMQKMMSVFKQLQEQPKK